MRRFLLLHLAVISLLVMPIVGEVIVLALTSSDSSSVGTQATLDLLSSLHDSLASSCGYFSHRKNEDGTTDYESCRRSFRLAGLKQFDLPENVIAAFIRNEQHFYLFADDQQDSVARAGGAQWLELESSRPATSLGPAQLQIHNIKRLILTNKSDGAPLNPQLAHLRIAKWGTIMEPQNSALLVGAYLREEALNLNKQGVPVTVETLAYATNPDVLEYKTQGSVLISPDLIDRSIMRSLGQKYTSVRLPNLTTENWRQVTSISRHARNVQRQLKFISSFRHSDQQTHQIAHGATAKLTAN